jgi:hypothetical protein
LMILHGLSIYVIAVHIIEDLSRSANSKIIKKILLLFLVFKCGIPRYI